MNAMNYSVPHLQNNESFNPLFAKMKERFCSGGTIAERMAVEAGICKKRSVFTAKNTRRGEIIETMKTKKASPAKKAFFSLKSLGTVSMTLLITGILFFSGASLEGVQNSLMTSKSEDAVYSDYFVSEAEHGTLYFADESLPEYL